MEGVLISLIISSLSAATDWDLKGPSGGRRRVFHGGRDQKGLFGARRRVIHGGRDQKGLFGAWRRVFIVDGRGRGLRRGKGGAGN